MTLKTIRLICICILMQISAKCIAQEKYHSEIGITGGGAFYLGDTNNQLFKNVTPSYGAFLRYNLNERIAFKAEFNKATVISDNISNKNMVNAVDICGEYNFFDLENNPNKRTSRIFSPYLFTGIGVAHFNYMNGGLNSLGIPFGIGAKLKLGNKWNLNAQWSNRLLFSDKLEGTLMYNNPYNLNGTNPLNNDILSTFTLGISYNFWKKGCDCLNKKN